MHDSVDSHGVPVWVPSVRVDWEYENFSLVSEAIQAGSWYMDCDQDGVITEVNWSHALRRMLGYHDILDFPNELQSWLDALHPDDYEAAVTSLHEVRDMIAGRTILRYSWTGRCREWMASRRPDRSAGVSAVR